MAPELRVPSGVGVNRAGQREKDKVNCNLSHDKELFIRGLN